MSHSILFFNQSVLYNYKNTVNKCSLQLIYQLIINISQFRHYWLISTYWHMSFILVSRHCVSGVSYPFSCVMTSWKKSEDETNKDNSKLLIKQINVRNQFVIFNISIGPKMCTLQLLNLFKLKTGCFIRKYLK